jgi:hypothetical protein
MTIAAFVPRAMLEKKPRHGAPCNRCGLCCFSVLCDLAKAVHGDRQGPCPELQFDAKGSRCGLIERTEGIMREDAKLLINSGRGCDMLLRNEQRNHRYTSQRETFDRKNRTRLDEARRRWGFL